MFQTMGVFAAFERAMIRERINAGLARAKTQGKVLGRIKIDSAMQKATAVASRAGDPDMIASGSGSAPSHVEDALVSVETAAQIFLYAHPLR
jgi:DNA invertase Pin-like site-specific DNA recombinase